MRLGRARGSMKRSQEPPEEAVVFRTARFIPLIAVVALSGAMPAAAPAAKKKVQCVKRSGDTIYRDSSLRVFQTVKKVKGDPDASIVKIFYCTPGSTKKPKQLTGFQNNLDESFTVMGVSRGGTKYLALELAASTGTADANELFVYDLTTHLRTFAYASENPYEHYVTSDGGVAILEGGAVKGFDASGEKALGTAATALAGSGNVVYWTSNGAAQTATLTGAAKSNP